MRVPADDQPRIEQIEMVDGWFSSGRLPRRTGSQRFYLLRISPVVNSPRAIFPWAISLWKFPLSKFLDPEGSPSKKFQLKGFRTQKNVTAIFLFFCRISVLDYNRKQWVLVLYLTYFFPQVLKYFSFSISNKTFQLFCRELWFRDIRKINCCTKIYKE